MIECLHHDVGRPVPPVKPGLHIYEAFQNICQVETIHTVILTWKDIEKFMNWQFT